MIMFHLRKSQNLMSSDFICNLNVDDDFFRYASPDINYSKPPPLPPQQYPGAGSQFRYQPAAYFNQPAPMTRNGMADIDG